MSKTPLSHQRISRILDLSMDYKRHKQKLREINNRSDITDYKNRSQKLDALVEQRNRYKSAVKRESSSKLEKDNYSLIKRLIDITQRAPTKLLTRNNSASSLKSHSLSYCVKDKIYSSRKQILTTRKKQKIPKDQLIQKLQKVDLKDVGLIVSNRQHTKNRQYKRSIRRFSQKNKNIRTSILEKGLMIPCEFYPFLPNVNRSKSVKEKNKSKNKRKHIAF